MELKHALFEQLVAAIASAHQLHYDMMKEMPRDDLTPLQYEILEFLAVEQPRTLSQISECKGLSMPNTSREIRKLTERGLCEKLEDKEDRRKQHIRLSAQGESRMAAALAHMQAQFFQRIEGMPEEELARVSEAVAVLKETIFRPAR